METLEEVAISLFLRLIARQQSINSIDLILSRLPLVRPTAHTDVALYPHHAVRVQHTVALSYHSHALLP